MTADAPAPASAALSTTLNKGAIILGVLEQRENAAVPLTLELHPPPQPVPRRKRPLHGSQRVSGPLGPMQRILVSLESHQSQRQSSAGGPVSFA